MTDAVAAVRARARTGLPAHIAAYIDAAENDHASGWDALRFRPRVLTGPRVLDTATTVLGTPVRTPVLIAPMAQQVAVHPDGEAEMARAAAASGTLLGVSSNTAIAFHRIAAAGAPWWFQVYLLADRAVTMAMARRAAEAGARAVILTVDTTQRGVRAPGIDPTEWPPGPERARLTNLLPEERAALAGGVAPAPGVDDIAALAAATGLPVVVKGVLRADDAVRAVDAGAAALLVSTHGDRRMAGSIGSLDALPEVVAAVGDRVEVYVDSGVRRGSHVLAALALGARAVFVGRPAMWGLADAGARGASTVVDGLTDEFISALDQVGATRMTDLDPSLLAETRHTR